MRLNTKPMHGVGQLNFADLDPQRRAARLLELLLMIGIGFKVVAFVGMLVQYNTIRPHMWAILIAALFEIVCFVISKSGHTRTAVMLLVAFFFVGNILFPLFFGIHYVFLMSSILLAALTAGLLLGMRAMGVTLALGFLLWVFQVTFNQHVAPLSAEYALLDSENAGLMIWMMVLVLMVIYAMIQQFYRLLEMQQIQANQLQMALTQLQESSVSNIYLDNILESISEMLVVTSADGLIERVNHSVYTRMGYERHEVIGQPVSFLLGAAARADGHSREIEHTTKDGQKITLVVSHTPLPMIHGAGGGRVYVAHDITELKRIRNDLEISKMRYQSAIMASRGGVMEWDIERNVVHVNTTLLKMLGQDTQHDTFSADVMVQYIHPDDYERVQQEYVEVITRGNTQYSSEYRLLRSDGGVIWVMVRGIIRYMISGKPENMVLVYIDVTDQRLAEKRALEVALEKEKLNLLTKFVNDASHHFRTSLTVILTSVWLLKRTESPEKRQERIAFIEEHAITLNRLFESLFKMFRIDMLNTLSLSAVRINDLIQEVLERTETFAGKHKITLEVDLDDSNPTLCADPDELGQAIINIVENAIIYNHENGLVRVCTRHDDQYLYIDVIDKGIGIAPGEQTRIFERLYKSDPARSKGGMGLGLTMSRKIVELHHGDIVVKSQLKQGSTFTIRLPLHDPQKGPCR